MIPNGQETENSHEHCGSNDPLDRRKAYEEFLACLKENKGSMSSEKMRQILKYAFQGDDLKYVDSASQRSQTFK